MNILEHSAAKKTDISPKEMETNSALVMNSSVGLCEQDVHTNTCIILYISVVFTLCSAPTCGHLFSSIGTENTNS